MIVLLRPKNNNMFLFLCAAFAFVIGVFDSTIFVNAGRLGGGGGGGGTLKDILLAECDNLSSSTNNYNYNFKR